MTLCFYMYNAQGSGSFSQLNYQYASGNITSIEKDLEDLLAILEEVFN